MSDDDDDTDETWRDDDEPRRTRLFEVQQLEPGVWVINLLD